MHKIESHLTKWFKESTTAKEPPIIASAKYAKFPHIFSSHYYNGRWVWLALSIFETFFLIKKKLFSLAKYKNLSHFFFYINTTFKSLFKKNIYLYVFKCERDDMGLTNKIISNR